MFKPISIFTVLTLLCSLSFAVNAKGVKEIAWDDLMPSDWEPEIPEESHDFVGVQIPNAPVVLEMHKRKVKIPGFMLPTKQTEKGVTEFLLVPYLGACIHVPPPPGNQIVFVTLEKPYPSEGLYDPIWVTGVIEVEDQTTEYADSAYSIHKGAAEEYFFENP